MGSGLTSEEASGASGVISVSVGPAGVDGSSLPQATSAVIEMPTTELAAKRRQARAIHPTPRWPPGIGANPATSLLTAPAATSRAMRVAPVTTATDDAVSSRIAWL